MKKVFTFIFLATVGCLMAQPAEFSHNNVCGGSPPPILYAQVFLDGTALTNGTWVAAFTDNSVGIDIAGNAQSQTFGPFAGVIELPVYEDNSDGTTCTVDAGVSGCGTPGGCEKFGVVVAVPDGGGGTCFYAT
ncbi:MAG: hypothetical protein AAFU03_03515, partial [Bacteroidota bacterium]